MVSCVVNDTLAVMKTLSPIDISQGQQDSILIASPPICLNSCACFLINRALIGCVGRQNKYNFFSTLLIPDSFNSTTILLYYPFPLVFQVTGNP